MAEAVAAERPVDEAPAGHGGRCGRQNGQRVWWNGRRVWRGRPPLALMALVATAAAVYAAYSLLRLRAFRASTYDLVIFDQAVRSYSRFEAPVAMVKGVHNGFGPDFSILGDHFSPILALLAPLYWIHDGPGTLLVAQAVLLALAIVPIWTYAGRRLGRSAAYCVAAAYALSWPIAEAIAFDFHEVAFVPLLSALLVERYDAGRRGQAAAVAGVLLLVKEDMGLLLVGFGLVLLITGGGRTGEDDEAGRPSPRRVRWRLLPRGDRRAGIAYMVVGLVATWLSSRVLIATFGGNNTYYWAYGSFGRDLPDAALHVLTHPWDALVALGSPPLKLRTMALLVLPLLLLPLLSPLTLAALPLLAERMLADRFGNWWEPRYHYNAFLIAILVMASVDGAARLRRLLGSRRPPGLRAFRSLVVSRLPGAGGDRRGLLPAAGLLLAVIVTVPFFEFRALADPGLYQRNERARAAAAATAVVPDGVLVETVNELGPALSSRARVLLWDRSPRQAPWVVADVDRPVFPFISVEEQRQRVDFLVTNGYRPLFRRDGYVVLHRPGPDPW